ncbi:MAG: hypothetical protein ACRCXV_09350 [Bacteroidales bacterium]
MSNRPNKFKPINNIDPIRSCYYEWVKMLEIFGVKDIPTFEEYKQIRVNNIQQMNDKLCMVLYKDLINRKQ